MLGWFGTLKADDIHFKMSPNPSSGKVELALTDMNAGTLQVEIFNVLGSKILTLNYNVDKGDNSITLNLNELPEGVYLVRVQQNSNASVKRLKIQHTD